jgi:ribosomal protein S7
MKGLTDMAENIVQQLTEELIAQTKRAQTLQQIVDELFTIAAPGAVKNALWALYQGIEGASPGENGPRKTTPMGIDAKDAEEQARQDWSNDE